MQVRWINHPTQPQKNGTTEHISREFAIVAEGYGQCVRVKFANYVERLKAAQEAPRQVHSNDNSCIAPVLPVGFGIVKRVNGTRDVFLIQEVTAAGEALIYEGVPAGCPASLVKQWQELNGADVDPAIAAEAARVAQCQKQNADAENKQREDSAFHRIFGGR